MIAHFLEASVNFQTGDVLKAYGIVFGALAIIAVVTYVSAINKQK
ncbi:MAG TPA: hypothetical protein VKA31_02190 [Mariprofundaceae bacterium]|nr:hypothetical protein [Mariprofundaceae bacterium]